VTRWFHHLPDLLPGFILQVSDMKFIQKHWSKAFVTAGATLMTIGSGVISGYVVIHENQAVMVERLATMRRDIDIIRNDHDKDMLDMRATDVIIRNRQIVNEERILHLEDWRVTATEQTAQMRQEHKDIYDALRHSGKR
jgi:hypothetical protein